ncbi:MAG: cytochrome b/b6 domain-containing protein [Albidovulum sp.]
MDRVKVWDPVVRIFHWALVLCFGANALVVDAESDLHQTIGYVVVGLIGLRIVWGLVGTRHARFSDFPPSIAASLDQMADMATGRRHIHLGHSPLGALMIYNLLLGLIATGLTGYMMTTNSWFGVHWVKEAHEIVVTWMEISVVGHILAVIFESRRLKVNLAGSMVTGVKTVPAKNSPAKPGPERL